MNHRKPGLLLLATGGTIAGQGNSGASTQAYVPAALPVGQLIASVEGLDQLARIQAEQPYSIGSQHLRSSHWFTLAQRVGEALRDPAIDGIVITHGTDTLEETALFLDLTCPRIKPIALTGAMRPATALGADGPMNLYAAAAVAADPDAAGGGAMVVMNDQVFAPHQACKAHTSRTDAFIARDAAPLAVMANGRPSWRVPAAQAAAMRPTLLDRLPTLPKALPRVDLLASQVDVDPAVVDWLIGRGAQGIVVAATGHGSLPTPLEQALREAVGRGCLVVRASRVAAGPVHRGASVDDEACGFVAAGFLPPHKARLVASLALAAALSPPDIQALFERF